MIFNMNGGGGDKQNVYVFETSMSSQTKTFTFNHALGVTPKAAFILAKEDASDLSPCFAFYSNTIDNGCLRWGYFNSDGDVSDNCQNSFSYTVNDSIITFQTAESSFDYDYFYAGVVYYVVLIV